MTDVQLSSNRVFESKQAQPAIAFTPSNRVCEYEQPHAAVAFTPSNRVCESQQPHAAVAFTPSNRVCEYEQPHAAVAFTPSNRVCESQQPHAAVAFTPSNRVCEYEPPHAAVAFTPSNRVHEYEQPHAAAVFTPSNRVHEFEQPHAAVAFTPSNRVHEFEQPHAAVAFTPSNRVHEFKQPHAAVAFTPSNRVCESQQPHAAVELTPSKRVSACQQPCEAVVAILLSSDSTAFETNDVNTSKDLCSYSDRNSRMSTCLENGIFSNSSQYNYQEPSDTFTNCITVLQQPPKRTKYMREYRKDYYAKESDENNENRLKKMREYARLQRMKKRQKQSNHSINLSSDHTEAMEIDSTNNVQAVPNCLVQNTRNNNKNTSIDREKNEEDELPDIAICIEPAIYPPVTAFYAGLMTTQCPYCNAFRFPTETLNCCHKGKVTLTEDEYSPELLELFSTRNFLNDIRAYNSAFAFASLGAQIEPPRGYGPYCFRIHGQIYHRTGTLYPAQGQRPAYGQVYILEANAAVQIHVERNPQLSEEILKKIFTILSAVNPFAAAFNHMHEVERNEFEQAQNTDQAPSVIKMVIKEGRDPRRYNAPLHDEVAAVFVGEDGAPPGNHDIVIYPRNQPLQRISYMNANCDALMYPLLFPSGQIGWHANLQHNVEHQTRVRNKLTQLQYYSYRLAIRPGVAALHQAGKLFHQYIVDAYVKTEAERLTFIRTHQSTLRADKYQGLMDHVQSEANARGLPAGKIVILPSTFPGSPRAMQQNFQDAMAMVTTFGKPDIFLTFTCNPRTREIKENLLPGQQPQDRPDLISRVFHQHLSELLRDIKCRNVIGKMVADLHVIEFQKRGLPHAHILIWLAEEDKLYTADDIDRLICAEIPDRTTQPVLHDIIVTNNMHGPCGVLNPECVCMKDGTCSKNFPKEFNEETDICLDGYPDYRRRNNGTTALVRGFQLDNRWVVPYNPQLSLKYRAHINVEACMTIKCVKYLFKYVYKGHDCASVELTEQSAYNHDEVKTYCDARYVSAPEAMWRLSEYHMSEKSHCVIRLPVHLPHEQQVFFMPGAEAEAMDRSESQLTAWFKLNTESEDARQHLYTEIPKHYIYNKKQWKVRKRGKDKIIVRMYSVSPVERERFCLRLLLLHVPGAMSFDDLKTYNDEIFSTFSEACLAKGLLSDDREWDNALTEAATLNMPKQCRQLFVSLLTHCHPSDPRQLWLNHKESLAEDYCRNLQLEVDQAIQYALADINDRLAQFGFSCASFNLPTAAINAIPEEVDLENELRTAEHNMSILNPEQSAVVRCILQHVDFDTEITDARAYFLDGPGGTGKTLVYNTLIAAVRSRGKQVAACAWTGIAAILLNGGVTVHNLFKLPVPVLDNSVCNVKPASKQGRLLQKLDLILIDEASMIPNHALNAIDRLLQDITGCKLPFGGKLILFGGDFRQVLPVVPRATPAGIVEQCLKRSSIWRVIKKFQLIRNMRALESEQNFAAWLLQLGNGDLKSTIDTVAETCIDIPATCTANIVDAIFPNFNDDRTGSVILTPKNDTSLELSNTILERLAGLEYIFYSCDCVLTDDEAEAQQYPLEFLHSITPSGMPPHVLKLKIGATVMLLRNLDTKRGLCNGVRLKIVNIHSHVLEAEIITGSHIGSKVLIPKLKLAPSDANLPFVLQRCQYPVRLSYVMTINKSQGQTFDKVGIYLPKPVFSHGQLYVAFSRARALSDISVCVVPGDKQKKIGDVSVTPNVVFKEVL